MSASRPERDSAPPEVALVSAALDHEAAHGRSARGDVMRAMNALCGRLGVELGRWLGRNGWQALLGRAVVEAHRRGAPLALTLNAGMELRWTDDATRADARAGCVQVLVALIDLLARFIGIDLAMRLVEQSFAAGDGHSGGTEDD